MSDDDAPDSTGVLVKANGALAFIGLLTLIKFGIEAAWTALSGFRAHLWPRLWKKNYVGRYGKWAVITGSTDGIGKEYAKHLAQEKMNILLISRNPVKLGNVASEIGETYGVETEIVKADFSDGSSIYEDIAKHLANKEIGILVNNVGVMLPRPMKFAQASDFEIWSHINVNVASVPAMTKLVLPDMVTRGKGAIINIASIAGSDPIPLMGIYAATKAFVDYFSQALDWEYRGSGVTIQTVNPGYVKTNMISFSDVFHKTNPFVPSATRFAAHALSTLGYASRTSGYWVHGIQSYFVENFTPKWMFMGSMHLFNKLLLHRMKNQDDDAAVPNTNTKRIEETEKEFKQKETG